MPPNIMWKDPKLGTETKAVFRQAVLKCDHFSEAFSYSFSIFSYAHVYVHACIYASLHVWRHTHVSAQYICMWRPRVGVVALP